MKKQIRVVAYNPQWPKQFQRESQALQLLLGDNCLEVHHIGSTSVPGLAAKEDIDVLCLVKDLNQTLLLQDNGFVFKGELNVPLRYFFSKRDMASKVNVHVCEADHGFAKLNLRFRDFLRGNNEARDAYAQLKQRLVQDPQSHQQFSGKLPEYTLKKDDFIKSLIRSCGFEGLCVNFCMHEHEWDEYRRMCQDNQRDATIVEAANRFYFCLYRGIEIVSVSCVEIHAREAQKAVVRFLLVDRKRHAYKGDLQQDRQYLLDWIKRWVKNRLGDGARLKMEC